MLSLALAPGADAQHAAPGHVFYARVRPACAPAHPRDARCFALLRVPVSTEQASAAGVRAFVTGAGASAGTSVGPAGGLTPDALAHAYGYEPDGGAAEGQTVAVVDAYDDPRIEADLAAFDAHYGLGECTQANGCFRKLNQEGLEKPLPSRDRTGWSWETSLDVETVRAVCNRCRILLVEASSAEYKSLASAARSAVAHGATELSNSYGGPESGLGQSEANAYNDPGVVVTAASGDLGWDDWNYFLEGFEPPAMPNAPASLATVVSVGGTSLQLTGAGTRSAETVWNDDGPYDEAGLQAGYATGGGCSTRFSAEPWQRQAGGYAAAGCGSSRLSADVAADGDPLTGFDIYDDYNFCGAGGECAEVREALERYGGWETFGGTSLSSPIVASMYALAGGPAGLRYPGLTLYAHLGEGSALYDVTGGGSGICDGRARAVCGTPNNTLGAALDCEGTTACDAGGGLDGPSGVGAPVGVAAFEPLFPTAVISLPPEIVAGAAVTLGSAASHDPNPGAQFSSWSWAFGDGSANSAAAAPVHTFAAPGEYTIKLSLVDGYGLASVPASVVAHVITRAEAEARAKSEEEARQRESERLAEEPLPVAPIAPPSTPAAGGAAATPAPGAAPPTGGVSASQAAVAAPLAQLAGAALPVSRSGRVRVRLSCPAGVSACTGVVTLRVRRRTPAGAGRGHGAPEAVASAAFSVPGGQAGTVVLRLDAAAVAALEHARSERALATIDSDVRPGGSHPVASVVTLHIGSRRHRAR